MFVSWTTKSELLSVTSYFQFKYLFIAYQTKECGVSLVWEYGQIFLAKRQLRQFRVGLKKKKKKKWKEGI